MNNEQKAHSLPSASLEQNGLLGDVFLDALLKTLNSVYKNFQLIKKQGSIYVVGYNQSVFDGELPKEGVNLDICYSKDIVIIDRNCIKPFTKSFMKKNGRWKKQCENKDWLKGFTAGCKIFEDIVRSHQNIA